jgi:hypothetical protein
MDTADKDKKLEMPLLLIWGARGQSPERAREFLDVWRAGVGWDSARKFVWAHAPLP